MKYSDLARTALLLGGFLSIPQLAGADPVNISTGGMTIGSDGTQYVIDLFHNNDISAIMLPNICGSIWE